MTGVYVDSPDGNRLLYLQAGPDVQAGTFDSSAALEVSTGEGAAFGGALYVMQEDATLVRYEVGPNFEIEVTGRLSFANFEIGFPRPPIFFSASRAAYVESFSQSLIYFDPTEMVITGEQPFDGLNKPGWEFTSLSGGPQRAGERWFYPAIRTDRNEETYENNTVVAIFADDPTTPVRVLEDGRCGPGYQSFVDEQGDFYVIGDFYSGWYTTGRARPQSLPLCMLRIKNGASEFDPSYTVDVGNIAQARALLGAWHLRGREFVSIALPLSIDFAALVASEEFYTAQVWETVSIDADTGERYPIEGLERSAPGPNTTFEIDGRRFLQVGETSDVAVSALYELGLDRRATRIGDTRGSYAFISRLR
jgi:hypothetical protein